MKKIELKQKCEDCKVNLVWLKEMDDNFNKWIKEEKKNGFEFPKDKLEIYKNHKTIYCPKCCRCYDKDFKKLDLCLGMLGS